MKCELRSLARAVAGSALNHRKLANHWEEKRGGFKGLRMNVWNSCHGTITQNRKEIAGKWVCIIRIWGFLHLHGGSSLPSAADPLLYHKQHWAACLESTGKNPELIQKKLEPIYYRQKSQLAVKEMAWALRTFNVKCRSKMNTIVFSKTTQTVLQSCSTSFEEWKPRMYIYAHLLC